MTLQTRGKSMKSKVLLIPLLLSLCGNGGDIIWEFEQFSEGRPAYPKRKDSPVASFRVSAMRPIMTGGFADQQHRIEKALCSYLTIPSYDAGRGEDPFVYGMKMPIALRAFCDDWYKGYEKAAKEAQEEGALPAFLDCWFMRVSGRVYYIDDRYLTYVVERSEHEGGMHPNVWYRYLVWSFEKERPLWLDDILDLKRKDAIIDVIRESAVADAGATNYAHYVESTHVDIESIPKNFAIEDRGVMFVYNDYENGFYRGGPLEIRVAWDDLRPVIKEPSLVPKLRTYRTAVEGLRADRRNPIKVGNLIFYEVKPTDCPRSE